jgi:microcystin-dependent protein
MVSTFTPNVNLEEPARGDDVGTWDVPVNNNTTELDLCLGGIATISAAAGSVVLSPAQLQSRMITFNSTLISNITVTFKTSFIKDYKILHVATGSSAFTITLQTTNSNGGFVGCPPGVCVDVYNDGTSIKFVGGLHLVGEYWDYSGSLFPNWVSASSPQPYLNCDGSTFSSASYPQLAALIGTTLPDARGRVRATLNQGTGRMTSGNGGVDGNTNFAAGGADTQTLTAGQIPTITGLNSNSPSFTGTQTNGFTPVANSAAFLSAAGGINVQGINPNNAVASQVVVSTQLTANNIAFQSNNTGGGAHTIMQPTLVAGLTLIRGA